MAVSLESPSNIQKDHSISMNSSYSSPLFSPSSEKRFWSALRNRIDTLLENRKLDEAFNASDLTLQASLDGKSVVGCQKCRPRWRISFALDTGGTPDIGGQDNVNGDTGLGQTRLGRIVGASGRRLLERLNEARKNIPMKIFLLLLGFYTANALATILGQTGDWDVLVAGVVVAAIEGIGMLMYKMPRSITNGRFKSLVVMVNFWKAGVCLGLFVDAFKLGS
ncbi:Ycf20-like protein [Thalictrum thalictroides]|uniref:Ycf20-like protein n=1 Tax=Thalictrum thalictroides TaxID=46969 RepID=A0A7J6XH07_THATH|nr:Ycf20-like protein [Thalictrum thalictroides]